jgi:hypothetical protein
VQPCRRAEQNVRTPLVLQGQVPCGCPKTSDPAITWLPLHQARRTSLGYTSRPVKLSASEFVDRPPTEVFRFVATEHWKNHPTWDSSIIELQQTRPGPIGVGVQARLVRVDRGRRSEGIVEVVAYEPDHFFEAVSRFGPFLLDQRMEFAPVAEGTRIDLTIDTKATGLMALLVPLMKRQFSATMARSLRTIKDEIERQPGPP